MKTIVAMILLIGAGIWVVISYILLIIAESKHGHPNYWTDK